jgi:hypothetical protein
LAGLVAKKMLFLAQLSFPTDRPGPLEGGMAAELSLWQTQAHPPKSPC